jgi:L-2-hydroxyglutarate oxidase LhgO
MEPNISGITALYSSETGIIDSHRLMQYFFDSAKDKGAMVSFNSEVTSIEKAARGYEVLVRNGNEALTLRTRVVINCAGLDSDEIAKIAGVDTKKNKYNLKYCKGQYFRVDSNKSRLVDRLIYPVPKPKSGGLGIHSTLDLAGSMRLGPDDFYQKDRSKDYSVDKSKKYEFYNSAKKFLPFIEEDNLTEDTSGIRPKLQGEGEDFRDFVIKDELESGLAGFINLIGIESPGLTAAPAIARYVNKLARKYLNG